MLPYLYLFVIITLSLLVFYLQAKGELTMNLYNDWTVTQRFNTNPHIHPLYNHLTLSSMSKLIHTHPRFNLSHDIALMIQATMITDIIHNCMCKECGKHIANNPNVISDYALEHLDEWAKTEQERMYLILILGMTVEDRLFWSNIIEDCKQEEWNDTLIELIKLCRTDFGIQTNTLNQN